MKNRMNGLGGLLALIATVWLTGCVSPAPKGVCLDNVQKGYATILCQPSDIEVLDGEKAVFKVKAKGTALAYHWFFKGMKNGTLVEEVVGGGTTGGNTRTLTVTHALPDANCGQYWCEIESSGPLGMPVVTRTREASLGFRKEPEGGGGGGGGGVQTYPPQQASAPKPKSGTSNCGSHCTWVGYQNGGAGFDPDLNTTKGLAKVRVGANYRDNTTYHLRWFDSAGGSGCAANSTTDIAVKEFTSDPNLIYFFTVYLMTAGSPPTCLSQGTQVYFELSFVP